MSQGNRIVLHRDRGFPVEGIIAAGQVLKPGSLVQMDPTVARENNVWTWTRYDRDANGNRPKGPLIILTEDIRSGSLMTDAYPTGRSRAFGFIPQAGCEMNILKGDVTGTGDDFAKGDLLIPVDATGKFILTTGSPEIEPFMVLETVTDPTADVLVHSVYTGY
jgi:hypothetical protein